MAGHALAEVHQLVADAAEVHDGAGHDEERNRQHGEGLRRVHDLLQNQPRLGGGVDEQEVEERGAEQRVHDRHAQEVKDEHQKNGQNIEECQRHSFTAPLLASR